MCVVCVYKGADIEGDKTCLVRRHTCLCVREIKVLAVSLTHLPVNIFSPHVSSSPAHAHAEDIKIKVNHKSSHIQAYLRMTWQEHYKCYFSNTYFPHL